ncbi:MAG TPA: PPOX class F420-dependent oxidoreductase [Actinomycetota bacterium]|nr:PPOX class F420-dependent oxidoreductase [Actinomycetota bacterium]
MKTDQALEFARENKRGILGTINADGTPHLVPVFAAVKDGRLLVSTPSTTVKARNIARDPRVTMAFGIRPWLAIAGTARILGPETDDLPARLREYYKLASGEHPDWDDYDRAMIAEKRVLLEITPERVYPA